MKMLGWNLGGCGQSALSNNGTAVLPVRGRCEGWSIWESRCPCSCGLWGDKTSFLECRRRVAQSVARCIRTEYSVLRHSVTGQREKGKGPCWK